MRLRTKYLIMSKREEMIRIALLQGGILFFLFLMLFMLFLLSTLMV